MAKFLEMAHGEDLCEELAIAKGSWLELLGGAGWDTRRVERQDTTREPGEPMPTEYRAFRGSSCSPSLHSVLRPEGPFLGSGAHWICFFGARSPMDMLFWGPEFNGYAFLGPRVQWICFFGIPETQGICHWICLRKTSFWICCEQLAGIWYLLWSVRQDMHYAFSKYGGYPCDHAFNFILPSISVWLRHPHNPRLASKGVWIFQASTECRAWRLLNSARHSVPMQRSPMLAVQAGHIPTFSGTNSAHCGKELATPHPSAVQVLILPRTAARLRLTQGKS